MKELAIIYRACPSEINNPKQGRPSSFSKERCYESFYNNFAHKSDIYVVWDGDKNNRLYEYIEKTAHSINIISIDVKDNKKSLEACFNLAEKLDNRYLGFVEDDYKWLPKSYEFTIDALKLGYDPLTLYNHPDRYLRDDRGWYVGGTDQTLGRDLVGLTNHGYIRTCESTTGSFMCSKEFFNMVKAELYKFNNEGTGAMNDRAFWRFINNNYPFRLWSAIPGMSCHMQLPLTPHVNWDI